MRADEVNEGYTIEEEGKVNHENYISPQRMKHCELLRQPCHEPMRCGNVCQVVKKDASDLPIVMFDKPYQWLRDWVYEAVHFIGVLSICLWVGVAIGYLYARWFS